MRVWECGAPIRIPSALIEGKRGSQASGAPRAAQAKAKTSFIPPALAVDRLIAQLPQRTMGQLQQQWVNVLVKIEASSGKQPDLLRFRQAIIDEWGRKFRLALEDPDRFEWPSTDARPRDGSMSASAWHTEGMLAYLGYRVGSVQGVSQGIRRQILDAVFLQLLPPVNGPDYCLDWGPPGSPARLRRLATEIARFTKNAKRKTSADMTSAITDWERDLMYLHRDYYVGKFGFGWPRIE